MLQWVPILYYGTEQAYNGGNDPDNRNSLWPNFKTDHDMYKVGIYSSHQFGYCIILFFLTLVLAS